MANKYPWYEVVEGEEIEQGDILLKFPIFVPSSELSFPLVIKEGDQIPVLIKPTDVIVMTQSCDIVNDKVKDIILCPHFELDEAKTMDTALAKKDNQKAILKGRIHRYVLLEASNHSECQMNIRIVDFGRIFTLQKNFVRQLAANQNKRLRLCPPYREHLSQSFARFFMRVGLPQDIKLPAN